jgi:glucokinase
MILAGDIGGTKCNLILFERDGTILTPVFQRRFASNLYLGFEAVVGDFLEQAGAIVSVGKIEAAGFGLAGAVVDGCLHAGNVNWTLDLPALQNRLAVSDVALMNDVSATAYSLDRLPPGSLLALNEGKAQPGAAKAVLAAGTGLGAAVCFWDGARYRVSPSEAGLADFAPRTDREIQLLVHLKKTLEHVCNEEIISGRGFRRIHEFLDASVVHPSFHGTGADAASDITQGALAGACAVCVNSLDLWTEAYGAEAGNFALQVLALGGVYIAGGIAPKILPKLKDGTFVRAFADKAQLGTVLREVPVYIVLNEDAPVWGAAHQALNAIQ